MSMTFYSFMRGMYCVAFAFLSLGAFIDAFQQLYVRRMKPRAIAAAFLLFIMSAFCALVSYFFSRTV